ncbi:hypothetical protein FVE85_7528 [Porphyridium purpureum]|uniref:Uncharacterized protein n=1 Tax=Porphyridium purpureum TaxID=35688 RepID=A0A5J4ZB09_PORPP|nr:hypothetical protein FVE85_7528 [Porphyridium purpureum]|eukprot:POR2210..scf295_1
MQALADAYGDTSGSDESAPCAGLHVEAGLHDDVGQDSAKAIGAKLPGEARMLPAKRSLENEHELGPDHAKSGKYRPSESVPMQLPPPVFRERFLPLPTVGLPKAALGTTSMLVPPQLLRGTSNVATEDLDAMGIRAQVQPVARRGGSESEPVRMRR